MHTALQSQKAVSAYLQSRLVLKSCMVMVFVRLWCPYSPIEMTDPVGFSSISVDLAIRASFSDNPRRG